jgi:hypothetical protein
MFLLQLELPIWRRMWDDNIKINPRKIRSENVGWIKLRIGCDEPSFFMKSRVCLTSECTSTFQERSCITERYLLYIQNNVWIFTGS